MTDEWAVRVRCDFLTGAVYAQVQAFRVEKATEKMLMGEALYSRRHDIRDCVRGLTKEQAKVLEERMKSQIAFSRQIVEREQSATMKMLNGALKGEGL